MPVESLIEVHVPEIKRLFNAIDPSPFREKDIDPGAEDFIVNWAKELPRGAPLALVVHVSSAADDLRDAALLPDAIHEFFRHRAIAFRQRLHMLFRRGRISLLIGLTFLGVSIFIADLLAADTSGSQFAKVLREGVLIGGWVAMWKPIEIFLYDWWPIRADARLADRLAVMPVRIHHVAGEESRQ